MSASLFANLVYYEGFIISQESLLASAEHLLLLSLESARRSKRKDGIKMKAALCARETTSNEKQGLVVAE